MKQQKETKKQEPAKNDLLLRWQAPARPFKKRDGAYFQTVAALVFLIIVILLFIKEWLLIGVVLALTFVSYVLASIKPPKQLYKLTKKGLWAGEVFYRFNQLSEYWFEQHLGQRVLVLPILFKAPGKINIVLEGVKEKDVDRILREKLVFREKPIKTLIDNLSDFLKNKFPLSS